MWRAVVSAATSDRWRPVRRWNSAKVRRLMFRARPCPSAMSSLARAQAMKASAAYQPPRSTNEKTWASSSWLMRLNRKRSKRSSRKFGSKGKSSRSNTWWVKLAAISAGVKGRGRPRNWLKMGLPWASFSWRAACISAAEKPAAAKVAMIAPADVPKKRPYLRPRRSISCNAPTKTIPLAPPPSKTRSYCIFSFAGASPYRPSRPF